MDFVDYNLIDRPNKHGNTMLKRILDVLLVLLLAPLLVPVGLFLSLVIRNLIGNSVIFAQNRPGLHGVPFKMFKFRTMLRTVDDHGNLLPDEQRITKFGRFLRSTSLDELPGLWNVLKGEMSLVGPRPLLMEYLPLYNEEQARRHEVRPGITGWAQVNGRNAIGWEEKFDLDIWYVDNNNIWLDIKILFLTIFKVFRREGISAAGEATMPKFKGSSK